MNIDLRTTALLAGVTSILQVMAISLLYSFSKTRRGVGWWLLGFISITIGYMFLLSRDMITNKSVIVIENGLLILGYIFLYIGVRRFLGQKGQMKGAFSIFVIFVLSLSYYLFVIDNLTIRTVIFSLAALLISFMTVYSLFAHKTRSVNGSANFLIASFLGYGSFHILRVVVTISTPAVDSVFTSTLIQTALFVITLIAGIVWTFGFIIMTSQRANAETREAKEHFELIFQTSPDAVLITRLEDGYFVDINAGFTALTGFTRQDILGKTTLNIGLWRAIADRQKITDALTKNGFCDNVEITVWCKDGSEIIGLLSSKIINLQSVAHVISVVHDITERKRIQRILETLNLDLEAQVTQRTQEYLDTIQCLEREIMVRKEAEDRIQQLQNSLVERVSAQGRKMNILYDTLLYQGNLTETDKVLSLALDKITILLNAEATCVHQVNEGRFYQIAACGLSEADKHSLAILPNGWLDEGIALMSADLHEELRLPDALRRMEYRTYLAAMIKLSSEERGVLSVFWHEPHQVAVEDIALFSIIAEQIGVILENARLRKSLEHKAVQVERRRLARDLHDSVSQSLHGLSLNVDVLRNRLRLGQQDKVEQSLARLDQSARQSLKEMRLLLYEMRLEPLETASLVEALQTRLEAVEMRAGIDGALELVEPVQWPPAWEAELYCIATEALNNSLKHANASKIQIKICSGETWFEMCIRDNGQGFDAQNQHKSGIGLQSMRERAERLGGTLLIGSKPGAGTLICLRAGIPSQTELGENHAEYSCVDRG